MQQHTVHPTIVTARAPIAAACTTVQVLYSPRSRKPHRHGTITNTQPSGNAISMSALPESVRQRRSSGRHADQLQQQHVLGGRCELDIGAGHRDLELRVAGDVHLDAHQQQHLRTQFCEFNQMLECALSSMRDGVHDHLNMLPSRHWLAPTGSFLPDCRQACGR